MPEIVRFNNLQFDKLVSVDQQPLDTKERPEVSNKFRKLLFFSQREGLIRTSKKILSKGETFKLKKYRTLITVQWNVKLFVNYSTQTTDNPEHFVLRNEFFEINDIVAFKGLSEEINFNQFIEVPVENAIKLPFSEYVKQEVSYTQKGVFIYGLGDYARVYIAPNIKDENKSFCVDYNFTLAKHYKQKYNYSHFGLVPEESYSVLGKSEKPLAIIATYHSDHTRIAKEIYKINPSAFIFIEKPPCVTLDDIKTLTWLYDQGANLEIGYNRRFIPLNQKIRTAFYDQQKVITISVKEILINDSHWYFWPNQGTRITGNLTHWLDLAVFWINGKPVEINLMASPSKDETMAVSVLFSDGSLVNITVSDKGNSLRGVQENIEVRTKDETVNIEDYTRYSWTSSNGRKQIVNKSIRNKGHDAMYKHLVKAYHNKAEVKYTKEDLLKSATLTYYVSEMFTKGLRNKSL